MNTTEHTARIGVTTNLETRLLFDTRSDTSIESLRSKWLVILNKLHCLQGFTP